MFLRRRCLIYTGAVLQLLTLRRGASNPKVRNSSETTNGDLISITSWHAQTLTNVSWDIPVWRQNTSHLIVLIWKEDATTTWLFGDDDVSSRADSPPSSASTSYYEPTLDEPIFDKCNFRVDAFNSHTTNAFFTDDNRTLVTADLGDGTTWWYTASLNQEAPAATSLTSGVGNASVLLSEPGLYTACLLLANDGTCVQEECVNVTVYQPPYDFLEARTDHCTNYRRT